MNVLDLDSNPPPNLFGESLSSAVKKSLVEKCHKHDSCYHFITSKYNVKYYTLRKYFKKDRKGLPTFESGGRPTKLDQESQQNIKIFMRLKNNWDKMDIHEQIRSELKLTLSRRYPKGVPTNTCTKISKSTVRRWATKFVAEHELDRLDRVLLGS